MNAICLPEHAGYPFTLTIFTINTSVKEYMIYYKYMDPLRDFLLFFSMVVVGVLLEVVVSELHFFVTKNHYKENHFTYGKYIFLLLFPLVAIIIIVNRIGLSLLRVFIIFSVIGTFLELLVGFSYHKVVGQRLWTYHRYTLTRYTSLLSVPLWGLGGVLFWLLAQVFS